MSVPGQFGGIVVLAEVQQQGRTQLDRLVGEKLKAELDDLLDEIETALLLADVGVADTSELIEDLRARMKRREFADAKALLAALRAVLEEVAS